MPRIIFIACKIRHKPPHSQMFSDYLVIIQTTKDTFINVNVCEKKHSKSDGQFKEKVLSLPKIHLFNFYSNN